MKRDPIIAAEQAVLGALLLDNTARDRLDGLAVEHFVHTPHRIIYHSILDEIEDIGSTDTVGLFQRLTKAGKADEAGGLQYLNELTTATPTAANVAHYAQIVKQAAKDRRLRAQLQDAQRAIDDGDREKALRLISSVSIDGQFKNAPTLIDLRQLATTDPADPQFIVQGWLPQGEPTLLGAHGGAGKSTIGLYLAVCIARGKPFYGIPTQRRRVFLLSLEDAAAVLHWRLSRLCHWLGISIADLADSLIIADGAGTPAELFSETRDGCALTPAYDWLREQMKCADVLILDGASDAFGGSEINRRQVRMFVRAIRRLIPATGAALILAHVDKTTAKNTDTSQGYSGSTAWNNSVRARWFLRPDEAGENLILELQKANLAPTGAQIAIRWNPERHVFVGENVSPVSKFERELAEHDDRKTVLDVIRAADAAGDPMPVATRGERSAHVFAEARGLPERLRGRRGKTRFYACLEALRAGGAIEVGVLKRANRHASEVFHAK